MGVLYCRYPSMHFLYPLDPVWVAGAGVYPSCPIIMNTKKTFRID